MTKPRKPQDEKAVRTTITLNPKVYQWALELMEEAGHNSLSDFIADLIRRRKGMSSGVRYEIEEGQHMVIEDAPPKSQAPSKKPKAA
jgi:predicted CopG family antitoxin